VSANKPTSQNAMLKNDVPISFNRIIWYASKVVRKSKKMMWVHKASAPIKVELITQTSTTRPTLKSEPCVASKILLSKHTNEKANPWSYDRIWSSRRQSRGQKFASGDRDHWRPHHWFPIFNAPIYGQGDLYLALFTCLPWSWYNPWTHYDESLHFAWTVSKSYTCDRPSWPYQN
jgi:hypothetical protein